MIKEDRSYSIERNPWDSSLFKKECGTLTINDTLVEEDIQNILEGLSSFDFIKIINKNNVPLNNIIITRKLGAFNVDTLLTFVRKVSNNAQENSLDSNIDSFDISNSNMVQYDENILNIVRNSFKQSRFYNDPLISSEKAIEVYSRWVENSFNMSNKYFIRTMMDGISTGFCLYQMKNKNLRIELIAIDSKIRGKGLGTSIINNLVSFCKTNNIQNIFAGTQINNTPAINFYIQNGFKLVHTDSIFHLYTNEVK